MLRKRHQIGQTRHLAIVTDDLADHAGGDQSCQTGDVHRGFGVTRAHQRATLTGEQREDVAGGGDVVTRRIRVDRARNRQRTVGGRNAGCNPFAGFDGDGEGGLVPGAVGLAHQRQCQLLHLAAFHRQTDQAARMADHEVDLLGGGKLRRDDQITLVFAVFVIDQNEHPPRARFRNQIFGRSEVFAEGFGEQSAGHANS